MLYAVNGCKISIGTALDPTDADFASTDFSSLTYTEIKNWVSMGNIGDVSQVITSQIIGRQRDLKGKGTRNAGDMQNTFASNPLDAGQIAVIAAQATLTNYAFKVELNDKPTVGASPKNSIRYFTALVLSAEETGGGSNTIRNLNVMLAINSNIVLVAASPT